MGVFDEKYDFCHTFSPVLALSLAGCSPVPKLAMPEGRVLIKLDGGSPGHGTGIAGPAKSFVLGDTIIAFSGKYSGGVIGDPTFPILTGDEKSSNSIANIAEPDIGGTLWVGETLEVMPEWNAAEDMSAIVFQWMRSAPSEPEPKSSDYLPIPGANDRTLKLTRAERGRRIKVVAVHPDHDWYVDGYFDDWPEYGSFKIEPLAYGPVTDPGPREVTGPNSVTREELTAYYALIGETQAACADWTLDEKNTKHFLTNLDEKNGEFLAGYGERNRWLTVRAVSGGAQGFKKVLVRNNPPPGDWPVVMANGKGIRHDGTLWSWGDNSQGGLGLGYETPGDGIEPLPKRVLPPQ